MRERLGESGFKDLWNPNPLQHKVNNVVANGGLPAVGGQRPANINHMGMIPMMGGGDAKLVHNMMEGNRDANSIYRSNNKRNEIQMMPWGQLLPGKVEETLPKYPGGAGMSPTDGSWQVVNGTRFKFYVFSAYYDRRDSRMIRVIGATKTRSPERVWCRLWYPQANGTFTSLTMSSRVKVIRENWNLKYSACFVMCPLKDQNLTVPYAVSIVARLRVPAKNLLIVRNTDQDPEILRNFNYTAYYGVNNNSSSDTNLVALNQNRNSKMFLEGIPNGIGVCVKALHFNYDKAFYLMEFLEMNAMLGVRHFTFYNHTIGPRASCVLRHYMRPNFRTKVLEQVLGNETVDPISISILPWNLKMRSQKEIRTEGLFAALNDCLYRTMYKMSHVALIDLDEFIIPRHNRTLIDMLDWLEKKAKNKKTGSYSFQNAFFYLQFADDALMYEKTRIGSALMTQKKTQRKKKLHPQKQRSKYICRPEAVVEAGNHFVWEFILGKESLNVPATTAILQHYRVCEFGGDDCIKTPSVTDRTAQKHGEGLERRVAAMYKSLKVKCNLPDLPPPPTKPPPSPSKGIRKSQPTVKVATGNASITAEVLSDPKTKVNSTVQSGAKVVEQKSASKDDVKRVSMAIVT